MSWRIAMVIGIEALQWSHARAQAQAPVAQPSVTQPPIAQAPITLQGAGPFYRLTLPSAIYERAAFDDLRDLRVRNRAGAAVPCAWLDESSDAAAPVVSSLSAPLFAVPVPADRAQPGARGNETIGVQLRPDGSLTLAKRTASGPAPSADWVIDASQATGALIQARFTLATDALGVFAFTLEGSDDLRHWRRVTDDDQLVRLQRAGQTIERLAVDLDQVRARYLRLHWSDPAHAAVITGVMLDSVDVPPPVAAIEWSPPVRASACGTDYCDYPAPRGLPLQSVRIALADANTLAPIQLASLVSPAASTRRRPRNALYVLRHGRAQEAPYSASEQPLAQTVVYRLQQGGGEAISGAVALDGAAHTTLRLRTTGPISVLGSSMPVLSFGARPRSLAFLAQGQAPFVLSWNPAGQAMPAAVAGPLTLTQLMPGTREDQRLAIDVASVTLAPLETPPPPVAAAASVADATSHKPWLWAALGGGLLLLGAMAWSLLRSLKSGPT